MIWVKRGSDFWSSPDGRFDKIRVVVSKEKRETYFSWKDRKVHPRDINSSYYFVVYDWDLGNSLKVGEDEHANRWCAEQLKKHPPVLTSGRTLA